MQTEKNQPMKEEFGVIEKTIPVDSNNWTDIYLECVKGITFSAPDDVTFREIYCYWNWSKKARWQ